MAAAAAGAGAGANYPITPPGGAVALNTTWQRAEWVSHPGPLFRIVQEALRPSPCADVKPLLASIVQHLQRTDIFGPNEWQKFFNARVPRAPVSLELDTVLQTPCPFWPDRLVRDTHEVVYAPETVNGEALSSVKMGLLARAAPPPTPVVVIEHVHQDPRVLTLQGTPAHWVLISKEPIPGSIEAQHIYEKDKDGTCRRVNPSLTRFNYDHMTTLIPAQARAVWHAPLIRDALICITALFAQRGTWLYPHRNIQTRLAETYGGYLVVKGLTADRDVDLNVNQLQVHLDFYINAGCYSGSGLAVARTFGEGGATPAAK